MRDLPRTIRGVHAVCATLVLCSGCATIWDFQDPVDMHADAGVAQDAGAPHGDAEASADPAPAVGADATADSPAVELTDASAADTSALDASAGAEDASGDASLDASLDAPLDAVSEPSPGACAAACVPVPPSGWTGPLALYEATGSAAPSAPACGGAYGTAVYDGFTDPTAAAAACTCSCGPPTGATCSAPVMSYFADTTCTARCPIATQSGGSTLACTRVSAGACAVKSVSISAPALAGGSCTPSSSAVVAPSTWSTSARVCGLSAPAPAGLCAAGAQCTARTGLPFANDTYCIARAGDQTCPGGYPNKQTFYQSSLDTRACTACTCDAPTGETCEAASVTFFADLACHIAPRAQSSDDGCVKHSAGSSVQLSSVAEASGGTCAPRGGQPTGALVPTTPTTICCTM